MTFKAFTVARLQSRSGSRLDIKPTLVSSAAVWDADRFDRQGNSVRFAHLDESNPKLRPQL
jgi:hypothetical protein